MALSDYINTILATGVKSDMILGSWEGSVYSAAPATTPYTKTDTTTNITTNINEPTFFAGIFSIDGGTTWQDFNTHKPNNSAPTLIALQTQMMYAYSTAGTLTLKTENWSYFNGSTTTSSAYTFQYKVVIFAKSDQGAVSPQPVVNQLNFNTAYNYLQIFADNIYSFSLSGGTTHTITLNHNLGYIPKVRSFIYDFSYSAASSAMYDFGYYTGEYIIFKLAITTTSVQYFFDTTLIGAITGDLHTRIYYDS